MITLKILKPDDSIYWVAYFNSIVDCDEWLKEEKTRSYWQKGFRVDISDDSKARDTKEASAKAEIAARNAKILSLKADKNAKRSIDEANATIDMLIDFIVG